MSILNILKTALSHFIKLKLKRENSLLNSLDLHVCSCITRLPIPVCPGKVRVHHQHGAYTREPA